MDDCYSARCEDTDYDCSVITYINASPVTNTVGDFPLPSRLTNAFTIIVTIYKSRGDFVSQRHDLSTKWMCNKVRDRAV
jgi:hypothetical protein